MRRTSSLALGLLFAVGAAAAQEPGAETAANVEQRIDQSLPTADPDPLVEQPLSIEGSGGFGALPDASLADPISTMRLPSPLDAPDIEQRIDKGLTAAGETSEFPPDYAYGAFQRGWFLTAFARALDRATEGDAAAQTLLGELLSRGLGVKQDLAAAADWYQLAASNGDAEAQYALGRLYLEGQVLDQDYARAADYFEMAANQGHAVASRELAYMLLQGTGREKHALLAAAYLRKAARLGDMDAQYALAGLYVEGVGVVADEGLAARWFGDAARNGHVGAQVEYAIILFNGRGIAVNEAAAVRWFEQAANADNPLAQLRLSRLLADGRSVEANHAEAARWYMIARARGVRDEFMEGWLAGLDQASLDNAARAAAHWTRFDEETRQAAVAIDDAVDNEVE